MGAPPYHPPSATAQGRRGGDRRRGATTLGLTGSMRKRLHSTNAVTFGANAINMNYRRGKKKAPGGFLPPGARRCIRIHPYGQNG